MGSEMGNNNVSGIREEEKPAVEVAEKGQEAVLPDDDEEVKGENHIILGDRTRDFNTKGEELSSDNLSSANVSDAETQKSSENEIGSKESNREAVSQDSSSPELNDSNCQENDVQKTDSSDEGNYEKPLEIHDQPSIGKETVTNEVERTDSLDSETMSRQPSKSSEHSSEETHIVEDEPQEPNTSTGKCDAQLPLLRENLSEFCDSSTEVSLQTDLLENCIIHGKESGLISTKSEEDVSKQESTEEKLNELVVTENSAASSVTLEEDASSQENGEEIVVETTSSSEKAHLNVAGNKRSEDIEEDMAMGKATMAISMSESLNWESSLMGTSSASKLSSQNENASLLSPDAAENGKKSANIDFQDLFVNGNSNLDAREETMQTLDSSSSTLESSKPANGIQIETSSGTSAETEVLCNWSNQQCPSGQMPGLSTNSGNQVQRGKSPSFDFGFQLDAKSEDSDQTPLLHHDKTAARSFSGFANVRFQNRIIQTDYGRKSLDFEPVAVEVEVEVEEKTIRMERSDSDISRASFMNLLKKNEKGSSNSQFLPKKQEIPAANNSNHSEELALTSEKGGKQRKNRPSIFTSCICCTASIH